MLYWLTWCLYFLLFLFISLFRYLIINFLIDRLIDNFFACLVIYFKIISVIYVHAQN